jgi:hypothetical protein
MKSRVLLKIVIWCGLGLWLGSLNVSSVVSQGTVGFNADRSGERVTLVYKQRSARVNMEQETQDTLPGNPPHRYKVLFTAVKDKHIYLLVRVCSGSPISNPNAPCGGDRPCALLWIKAGLSMVRREIKSEIFASCSYNYHQVGKTRLAGSKLTIVYEETSHSGLKTELTYNNTYPERGILKRRL